VNNFLLRGKSPTTGLDWLCFALLCCARPGFAAEVVVVVVLVVVHDANEISSKAENVKGQGGGGEGRTTWAK